MTHEVTFTPYTSNSVGKGKLKAHRQRFWKAAGMMYMVFGKVEKG